MMGWIRLLSLFLTWTYAMWQQPPAGLGNLPFYLCVPGLLIALLLEEDTTWHPPD